mgnify:CR=1 FL=1|tara:strand:+ start:550 stop:1326 length:777 start_codon:yes stop_codon:yes gene_type:complete
MTQTTQRSLLNQQGNPEMAPVSTDVNAPDQGQHSSEQPVHNWEKRYKDLQSFNSRKINELTRQIEGLQVQGVPKVQAPRTPEEMDAFKTANPEMYAVIQHMATDIAQDQLKGYDQTMGAMQNDLLDTKMEKAELAIKAAHPDFAQIVESPQFEAWADRQTATIQDWIYNNPDNPTLAIQALSLFKYESGQANNTQGTPSGADLDVSQGSHGTLETDSKNHPARIWKASEIRRMSPKDFAKWDETIKLAQSEGRIDPNN